MYYDLVLLINWENIKTFIRHLTLPKGGHFLKLLLWFSFKYGNKLVFLSNEENVLSLTNEFWRGGGAVMQPSLCFARYDPISDKILIVTHGICKSCVANRIYCIAGTNFFETFKSEMKETGWPVSYYRRNDVGRVRVAKDWRAQNS